MDFTKLKECMDMFVEKYNTPGVDCVVYKDHEVLYRYYAGLSDLENKKPMNGNELYFIFSMTKMITCTCALQLLEKGKYTLNDPVSMYLPEFEKMKISDTEFNSEGAGKVSTGDTEAESGSNSEKGYAKNPITVKHLFTMSAGLDYDLWSEAIKESQEQGKTTTRDIARAISKTVLGFEPGTRYRYSLCHDVLGALVEVWSGKKLGDYMKENVFEPLGMKNTYFGVPQGEEFSRLAARYRFDENKVPVLQPVNCIYNLSGEYQSGGAGLTSCTEDYALFLDAIACGGVGKSGKRILSTASVELMGTNHLNETQIKDFNKMRPGYGYGLGVRTHIDKTLSGSLSPIGEFGWDGAAGAFAMVDTKNKLSLTYFQHCSGWNVRIQTEMRNALYGCLD